MEECGDLLEDLEKVEKNNTIIGHCWVIAINKGNGTLPMYQLHSADEASSRKFVYKEPKSSL